MKETGWNFRRKLREDRVSWSWHELSSLSSVSAHSLSHVQLFVTPWVIACLSPLSMEFSRQEDWSGLPIPTPGDRLEPGIELTFLVSPALAGGFFKTQCFSQKKKCLSTIPICKLSPSRLGEIGSPLL